MFSEVPCAEYVCGEACPGVSGANALQALRVELLQECIALGLYFIRPLD